MRAHPRQRRDASSPPRRRTRSRQSKNGRPSSTNWPSFFARGCRSSSTRRNHSRSSPANDSRHRPASASERLHAGGKIRRRQPHDVLLVEPVELVLAEDGVAAADAFERERGDELVAREDLLIGSRRPAEEREEVDHGLGKIAEAVILHHRRRAVPLAQTLLVRPEDERHVREPRGRLARTPGRAAPAWAYSKCDRRRGRHP